MTGDLPVLDVVAVFLGRPLWLAWGAPVSLGEVLGFATGLWCVWLAARRHVLNFPVGIANCALLLVLFFQAGLYADAGLQLVFIGLGIQGWWLWSRAGVAAVVPVTRLESRKLAVAIGIVVLVAAVLYGLLSWVKGSVPVFDALITSTSLVAQGLLNRRRLEHWYFWILVDLVSIPVYAYKSLYLVALLYVVLLVLCFVGLRSWRTEFARSGAEQVTSG